MAHVAKQWMDVKNVVEVDCSIVIVKMVLGALGNRVMEENANMTQLMEQWSVLPLVQILVHLKKNVEGRWFVAIPVTDAPRETIAVTKIV